MKDKIPGRFPLLMGFLTLCFLGMAIFWMTAFQKQAHCQIEKTLRAQRELSTLLAQVHDVETGRRGYLITGRPEFLRPHLDASAGIGRDISNLETSLARDPPALAALRRLRRILHAHDRLLAKALARHSEGGQIDSAAMNRAKAMMDEMRAIVVTQANAQDARLHDQARAMRQRSEMLYLALFLINLLSIGLFILVFHSMRERLLQAIAMKDALQQANEGSQAEARRREQIETQLHHLQKMGAIGRLSGVIAHDFKNMIAGIVMALGNVRMRLGSQDDTVREDIDLALLGTSRATELANRLLTFSRQQPLNPQRVSINIVIAGMADLLYRTIGRYLAIEMVLGEDLGIVMADPEQLETTIINLCLNAREAMLDGGRITIQTRNLTLHEARTPRYPNAAPGDYVALSISDTGAGMTPDVAARAFDPFYSTKNDSRGLGLSQVYGFVSQSGGHIRMFSAAGEGTTMKIILPSLPDDPLDAHPI